VICEASSIATANGGRRSPFGVAMACPRRVPPNRRQWEADADAVPSSPQN
jgi:hypothetical protein